MALSANVQTVLIRLNAELSAVFSTEELSRELTTQIQLIQEFYHNELTESPSGNKNQPLLTQYKTLIDTLNLVKAGQLTYDAAVEVIDASAFSQKIDAAVHNLIKVCELLFWLAAAIACFVTSSCIGIPLIAFEPVMGSILTVSTFYSSVVSLHKATTCCDEFKSFTPINNEAQRERNLLSFFAPLPPEQEAARADNHESLYPQLEDSSSLSAN